MLETEKETECCHGFLSSHKVTLLWIMTRVIIYSKLSNTYQYNTILTVKNLHSEKHLLTSEMNYPKYW